MKEKCNRELLFAQVKLQEYKLTVSQKEIDDNVGQLLSSIRMLLGVSGKELHPLADLMTTAQEALKMAIRELHLVSNFLTDYRLDDFNLVESLETEIARINHWKKANILFSCMQPSLPLPKAAQLGLFVVLLEVLTSHNTRNAQQKVAIRNFKTKVVITITCSAESFASQSGRDSKVWIAKIISKLGGKISWSLQRRATHNMKILVPVNHTFK